VFATIDDLIARSLEPLSAELETWASTKLVDAENKLITLVPRLAGDPATLSPRDLANAKAVICDAVIRLITNPGNLISECAGPFRAEFQKNDKGTALYFTEDELALFTIKRKRRIGNLGLAPARWARP
jgi:hypothetical protein